jgi:hypothetical protein
MILLGRTYKKHKLVVVFFYCTTPGGVIVEEMAYRY